MNSESIKVWTLKPGAELRVEAKTGGRTVKLRLLEGLAECFGAEMALEREYQLGLGEKTCIFSYQGAKVERQGDALVEYESQPSSPSIFPSLLEFYVKRGEGKRTLVLGQGKKSVTKTLANYAFRTGSKAEALLIDLNVSMGLLMGPGMPSVAQIDKAIELGGDLPANCLSFFYGYISPKDAPHAFSALIKSLSSTSSQKKECPTRLILGPSDEECLDEIIKVFEVDQILVIGNERLQASLKQKGHTVISLPSSGGQVELDSASRKLYHASFYHSYFESANFASFSVSLPIASLSVYRYETVPRMAPQTALPIGAVRRVDDSRLQPIPLDKSLLYCILGVLPSEPEPGAAPQPIRGLIYLMAVDEQWVTFLSPCPQPLPSTHLIVGELRWMPSSSNAS